MIWFIPVLLDDIELSELVVGTVRLSDYQAVQLFEEGGTEKLLALLRSAIDSDKNSLNPTRASDTTIGEAPEKSTGNKAEESLQSIRNAIAEDRLGKALNVLNDHVAGRHPDWNNDVILLRSRYRNLEKQQLRGLISREQYLPEKNRIVHAVLELIAKI